MIIDKIRKWREDPVYFVRDQFGVEPDDWQKDVLMAFPKHQRLAMKASKGVGKSAILSWLAWNFLASRPDPKLAATSISAENLSDGLWAEMAKWQAKSPYLTQMFEWTKTRIFYKNKPETWFMSARAWSKSAASDQQANALAGLHADYIMFILDESGAIPDSVMAAAEAALASGKECKLIQSGNPTHLEGPLYRACTTESHLWHVTEISSDPDNPKRSSRVSIDWAREQIEKYGRDNPWVLVNVFGKFPPASMNTLLGPDEVREAMKRQIHKPEYEFAQKRLGVDCARFGTDSTIIFPRQGLRAFKYIEMKGARSNEIAARIALAKSRWNSELEFIDGTGGFGSGVVDSLLQAGHSPQEIHFSSKATDEAYYNKRSEMWFNMAEWIKRGGALPMDAELIKELTAPQYTFKNGRFILEPKEQIKERLGFSPDKADALCLTFAWSEMPGMQSMDYLKMQNLKPKSDWDPFVDRDTSSNHKSDWDPSDA